jgi:hypothetical protein
VFRVRLLRFVHAPKNPEHHQLEQKARESHSYLDFVETEESVADWSVFQVDEILRTFKEQKDHQHKVKRKDAEMQSKCTVVNHARPSIFWDLLLNLQNADQQDSSLSQLARKWDCPEA